MTLSTILDEKERALATLRKAKAGVHPWAAVAEALLVLERLGPLDEDNLPWIRRAELESGISANQLRRMTRTLRFVLDLALIEPGLAEALHWRGFSAVEVIGKIYAADRAVGERVIREERPGSNFRQLLKIFDDVKATSTTVGGVSAGKLAAKQFVAQCQAFLTEKGASLLERYPIHWDGPERALEPHLVRVARSLRFATPDFVIFQARDKQVQRLDAVDCHAFHGNADRASVERRAVQIATEATLFDRFLVLVPEGTAASIFSACFDWFGLKNAVVINIDAPDLDRVWDQVRPFFPIEGGTRRDAWLQENSKVLQAILKAAKLNLSLTS